MVTIYDIAVHCGVSPSTVSKVINDYPAIPQATKDLVRKCMEEMHYIPNNLAQSLHRGFSRNVGVLSYLGPTTSPFNHPLFIKILDSFQEEMNTNNYDLIFISRLVDGKHGSFYQNCISRNVDGVLLFGDMDNEEFREIIESDIPKVGFDYFGNKMTGITSSGREAMKAMTQYLLNLGHRDIVFVHGEMNDVTRDRIEGFKDAILNARMDFASTMMEESVFLDKNSARAATLRILSRPKVPTAVMYCDDVSAVEGFSVFRNAGYRCPEDISITGFDGLDISQVVDPTITTARQDVASTGHILALKLIDAIKDHHAPIEHIRVSSSLLLGGSTGTPRKQ
jgi:LacI family transcriptional regulator